MRKTSRAPRAQNTREVIRQEVPGLCAEKTDPGKNTASLSWMGWPASKLASVSLQLSAHGSTTPSTCPPKHMLASGRKMVVSRERLTYKYLPQSLLGR